MPITLNAFTLAAPACREPARFGIVGNKSSLKGNTSTFTSYATIAPNRVMAIHTVSEQIQVDNTNMPPSAEVITTNIYELTPQGWRMILHHASPARVSKQPSATMH